MNVNDWVSEFKALEKRVAALEEKADGKKSDAGDNGKPSRKR